MSSDHKLAELQKSLVTLNTYEEKYENSMCRLVEVRRETIAQSAGINQQIVDRQLEIVKNAEVVTGEYIDEETIEQLKAHIQEQKRHLNEAGQLSEEIVKAKIQRSEAHKHLTNKIAAMKQIFADD